MMFVHLKPHCHATQALSMSCSEITNIMPLLVPCTPHAIHTTCHAHIMPCTPHAMHTTCHTHIMHTSSAHDVVVALPS